jgi:predicted MFS family arabinose efflux permease
MKLKPSRIVRKRRHIREEFVEGFRYVRGSTPIRSLLALMSAVSLAGHPYVVLLPIFATKVLGGGPDTLGYLMSAAGVGAISGAVYVASRKSVVGLGRLISVALLIFGSSLILFSFTQTLFFAILMILPIGFGMMVHMVSTNTVIQTIVEEDKRGRVMSLYVMSFVGVMPIGGLLSGALATKIGVAWTIRIGGFILILAAAVFYRRLPLLRKIVYPIYENLGILLPTAFSPGAGIASGCVDVEEDMGIELEDDNQNEKRNKSDSEIPLSGR